MLEKINYVATAIGFTLFPMTLGYLLYLIYTVGLQ